MASIRPGEPPGRPEPGCILLVIHDFMARSSDELSLSKGDRVELIERDDEFGDGWYLGNHLTNGSTGLFPEVYTRPAPRGAPAAVTTPTSVPRAPPATVQSPVTPGGMTYDSRNSLPASDSEKASLTSSMRHASASQVLDHPALTPPLITPSSTMDAGNEKKIPMSSLNTSNLPRSPGYSSGLSSGLAKELPQENHVMNETLNVIQEHITDMSASQHPGAGDRRGTNDSGSEYSSHLDHRVSYIAGEETDDEEEALHTEGEVSLWNPVHVAEYLGSVGVEAKHCEVFRDQEISGEVLLGMDQTSVFIKEFDLGSVGRRLKTWQKIKALQDEVKGIAPKRTTATYDSEAGSEESGRQRKRSSTAMGNFHRISSMSDRPGSRQDARYSSQQAISRMDSMSGQSPISPLDSPSKLVPSTRPSAASIRDMHHSRRQSSIDSGAMIPVGGDGASPVTPTVQSIGSAHKKQPSFDRGWTGSSPSGTRSQSQHRPISEAGNRASHIGEMLPSSMQATPVELDRGYFSGGELDGRPRNVLRRRSGMPASHSRNSSYTDEQRMRTATTSNPRHSRFGSVDSIREPPHLSPASQRYYGINTHTRRSPSVGSIRPAPPPKDMPSPTVTKLDGSTVIGSPQSPVVAQSPTALLSARKGSKGFGFRSISDAVTGNEKFRVSSPADNLATQKEESITSPSRTGSSTTSGGPSFELDSPNTSNSFSPTTMTATPRNTRKKSKKETSAYTRGLEKRTPQEAMLDCDYSGWMKKKSTNLMTTWKPRLFILKGRRLSYYYSENDEQEQGLIDISFHRVLPADSDRLTGLHATLTGATTSPTTPSNSHTPTMATTEAAAEPQSTLSKSVGDSMFIFKLVPPRAGLSKAVNFTKPTVHYFAVPNVTEGRLWMAALMKATIDRDESVGLKTTYTQKTISLAKARAMRHRPPALMNLDERVEEEPQKTPGPDLSGLNIRGIIFDQEPNEGDSGVSGVSKTNISGTSSFVESSNGTLSEPPHTS